jgi:hypothetical protein
MPFKYYNSRHHKSKKKKYRVRNWTEYNKALINRGGIIFILMEDITRKWYSSPDKRSPGGKEIYSDYAIEFCLQVRFLLKLPLRQTQGFLEGLFAHMNIDLAVPRYSELSIRASELNIEIKRFAKKEKADKPDGLSIIVDSTGMKIYGEGEWSKEKHKTKTRKAWRKLHIAIVENAMYRIKTIYGGKLKSRNMENQETESRIALNNINIMTGLGMPESYPVIS